MKLLKTLKLGVIILITHHLSLITLKAQLLSKEAKVSLITVEAGDELYSGFGHSALWVSDPTQGIDKVYNYGTFDFRTDNFYVKFIKGTLPYQLSVSPMYYTMQGAQIENRSVIEQVLNLSHRQKENLYNYLEVNSFPQNREYRYKFFFDNCSTRIRDALKAACGDSLKFTNKPIDNQAKSYRKWIMEATQFDKPWSAFGMSIAIGLPSDHICTPEEEMFLPKNLKRHISNATIGNKKLELSRTMPFMNEYRGTWTDVFYSPFMILNYVWWTLLIFRKRYKLNLWFDRILFVALGLVGLLFTFLWFGTDHGVTAWNVSLLIFAPTHFLLAYWLGKPQHRAKVIQYARVGMLIYFVFLLVVIASLFFQNSMMYFYAGFLPMLFFLILRLANVLRPWN